ncbi:MAG: hypothetical protein FWC84_05075, partial [Alphaproteobacteria bacterium]|nr:hypothetical protein [Alphaproteobacteria bacterium]
MILPIFRIAVVCGTAWIFAFLGPKSAFSAPSGSGKVSPPSAAVRPTLPFAAGNLPAPARLGGAPDLAYAAYQRGYFITALREAMNRVDAD